MRLSPAQLLARIEALENQVYNNNGHDWTTMVISNTTDFNTGGSGNYAEYRMKNDLRTVHIRGFITVATVPGSGALIWVPPTGFAPARTQRIVIYVEATSGSASATTPRATISASGLAVFSWPNPTTVIAFNDTYDIG